MFEKLKRTAVGKCISLDAIRTQPYPGERGTNSRIFYCVFPPEVFKLSHGDSCTKSRGYPSTMFCDCALRPRILQKFFQKLHS